MMRLLRYLFPGWFKMHIQDPETGSEKEIKCEHGPVRGRLTVTIKGFMMELAGSPMCEACTVVYLDKYSTICGSCGEPILPGEPVGQAPIGAKHPYTHLSFDCCVSGGLLCGRWGQGVLIPLENAGFNIQSLPVPPAP